jgi:8-oxo-dGTP pyrophosphatase MutT (NUDIX family)
MTPGQRAIISIIRKAGLPLTRKNYIDTNWTEDPDPWTAEAEAELPEFLQITDAQALGSLEAAGVMFRTKSGHMLLMKRKDTGEWSIPAGHLEQNETPLHGAQREAAEETGYPGNHRAYKIHEATTRGVRFHTFVQPSEWQFKPILNAEHTEHGWFRPSRLPEPLHPGLAATLHAITEGGPIPFGAKSAIHSKRDTERH